VGNARQAIEHHGQGGTIVCAQKNGERRVLLEVADDARNTTAILARIFDPFSHQTRGIGTGLGLALC